MNKIKLLNDQAIGEGKELKFDGLGFDTYSEVLSNAVRGTQGPFTIGIFGEWGTGKTSLMRMIKDNLDTDSDVITVWFNAWKYEKEEHPIVPLIATIVHQLESNKKFIAKLADTGKSFIKALRAVAYGLSAKSKVKVPGFAEIEASLVAKDIIDREEKLTPDPLLDRSLYYDAFEALENCNRQTKIKIVVIIDDLDRCLPDLAIKLLESIKLVLSQPGFIFILGVARKVLEGYLKHRYEKEYGLTDFESNYYLDKIVQLPFHIPPHQDRMENFTDTLLEQIDAKYKKEFEGILLFCGEASRCNPRAIIRLVNNIMIDHAIIKSGQMKPIPMSYFAVTRILQQRWENVFRMLNASDALCLKIVNWTENVIRDQSEKGKGDIQIIATHLLSDKELRKFLYSEQGKNWLQNGPLRKATIHFLRTQRRESEKPNIDIKKINVIIPSMNVNVEKFSYAINKAGYSVMYTFYSGVEEDFYIRKSVFNILYIDDVNRDFDRIKNVLEILSKKNITILVVYHENIEFTKLPGDLMAYMYIKIEDPMSDNSLLLLSGMINKYYQKINI